MIRISVPDKTNRFHWTGAGVEFSVAIPVREADGLLCWMSPTEELFQFDGPKGWYAQEALVHSRFRKSPLWVRGRASLGKDEFFHFSNQDERYRIPHITSYDDFSTCYRNAESSHAVAVVNNHGGRFWFLHSGLRLRNSMICENELVHLYGQPEWWDDYRKWYGLGPKGPPRNYKGAPSGKSYATAAHRDFLSQFKVNICMENTSEFLYFTEKFTNAVRAGCIPVYHAHDSVRKKFLQGARWVDPGEFAFCPKATIEYALTQDLAKYRDANESWLAGQAVQATLHENVMVKLAAIFALKVHQQA